MIVKSKMVLSKKLVLKRQIIKLRMKNNYCLILLFLGLSFSCSKETKDASTRFSLLSSSDTNIDFKNIGIHQLELKSSPIELINFSGFLSSMQNSETQFFHSGIQGDFVSSVKFGR